MNDEIIPTEEDVQMHQAVEKWFKDAGWYKKDEVYGIDVFADAFHMALEVREIVRRTDNKNIAREVLPGGTHLS